MQLDYQTALSEIEGLLKDWGIPVEEVTSVSSIPKYHIGLKLPEGISPVLLHTMQLWYLYMKIKYGRSEIEALLERVMYAAEELYMDEPAIDLEKFKAKLKCPVFTTFTLIVLYT